MPSAFFEDIEIQVDRGLYEPAEDTFLLCQTIPPKNPGHVLDLGCGSGIQGIVALKRQASHVTFADIDPKALACARDNARRLFRNYRARTAFVRTDLFEQLQNRLFDVILFNPPYVENEGEKDIALDGGKKGREIIDRFIEHLLLHLAPNGQCLMLQSNLNGLTRTRRHLKSKGLDGRIAARQRLFFEELVVLRIQRKKK